jgi:hypothetical protein
MDSEAVPELAKPPHSFPRRDSSTDLNSTLQAPVESLRDNQMPKAVFKMTALVTGEIKHHIRSCKYKTPP